MSELLSFHQKLRICVAITFFIAIFLVPWWILIPALFIGLFYFSYFIEFVIFAVLLDLLYGTGKYSFFGFHISIPLLTLIIFIVIEIIKDRLIFDNH